MVVVAVRTLTTSLHLLPGLCSLEPGPVEETAAITMLITFQSNINSSTSSRGAFTLSNSSSYTRRRRRRMSKNMTAVRTTRARTISKTQHHTFGGRHHCCHNPLLLLLLVRHCFVHHLRLSRSNSTNNTVHTSTNSSITSSREVPAVVVHCPFQRLLSHKTMTKMITEIIITMILMVENTQIFRFSI